MHDRSYKFPGTAAAPGTASLTRLPTIEPVVTGKDAPSAHGHERQRAQKSLGAAHMMDGTVAPRGALDARAARRSLPLVAAHGRGGVIGALREPSRKDLGVLDRHGGALSEIRQHRMGCIAQQRGRALAP